MSCSSNTLSHIPPQGKRQAACKTDAGPPRLPQSGQLFAFEEDLESTSDSASLPDADQHAEFYDSGADEQDQAWISKQRQGRRSDAILSCPGCLATVCIDCQRHEYITTQYRAMFVTNCRYAPLSCCSLVSVAACVLQNAIAFRVSTSPKLSVSNEQNKASGKRQRDAQSSQPGVPNVHQQVFPVFCGTCDAELGVQDADEVFHFYTVFPSTA